MKRSRKEKCHIGGDKIQMERDNSFSDKFCEINILKSGIPKKNSNVNPNV
jgi:hypothetical protein